MTVSGLLPATISQKMHVFAFDILKSHQFSLEALQIENSFFHSIHPADSAVIYIILFCIDLDTEIPQIHEPFHTLFDFACGCGTDWTGVCVACACICVKCLLN